MISTKSVFFLENNVSFRLKKTKKTMTMTRNFFGKSFAFLLEVK